MSANQVALSYLLASVLFILSLRGLSHPLTARRGNLFGMVGMALAVITTLAITGRLDLAVGALGVGAVMPEGVCGESRPTTIVPGLSIAISHASGPRTLRSSSACA